MNLDNKNATSCGDAVLFNLSIILTHTIAYTSMFLPIYAVLSLQHTNVAIRTPTRVYPTTAFLRSGIPLF